MAEVINFPNLLYLKLKSRPHLYLNNFYANFLQGISRDYAPNLASQSKSGFGDLFASVRIPQGCHSLSLLLSSTYITMNFAVRVIFS
jgi:hypothetical protein